MASVFGQNVKGLIYLGGVLLASAVNVPLMSLVGSRTSENASPMCRLFDITAGRLSPYNSPSPTTLFIAFTAAYLIIPMYFNGQMNYPLTLFLLGMVVLDVTTQMRQKCTTGAGAFLGILTGIVMGAAWYAVFRAAGLQSLLFFGELTSNNVVCSRPSQQTFKCDVFKNGELITSQT